MEGKGSVKPLLSRLLGLIPTEIASIYRKSEKHFTRNSKLPFAKLITFVLSITSSGKSKGVDSKSGEFIKNARRSGLWPDAEAIHRSTVTKARNKVPWEVFEEIHNDSVKLAYELWPESSDYTWKGMSVYAVDGSKYMLPATADLREEFDPGSGLQNPGKGHYPQCLVSTAYDVFRRLAVGRTVVAYDSSERDQAKLLIPKIPPGNLLLWDRGYPSFEFFKFLNQNYDGYYLFRSPASGSFSVVADFITSMKQEDVVVIHPPQSYIFKEKSNRQQHQQRREEKPITLRIIRLESPDGTLSVLLTNLMDPKKFSQKEITDLYYRRWEIESYYRDEKIFLDIDTFHSKTSNGIRQELFAALIMSVIARILMITVLPPSPSQEKENSKRETLQSPIESRATLPEPQFKNAAMALAADAAVLTPHNPEIAAKIFKEVLEEIRRVKYYRPKVPRVSKPRITKKPPNKWADRNSKRREKA